VPHTQPQLSGRLFESSVLKSINNRVDYGIADHAHVRKEEQRVERAIGTRWVVMNVIIVIVIVRVMVQAYINYSRGSLIPT